MIKDIIMNIDEIILSSLSNLSVNPNHAILGEIRPSFLLNHLFLLSHTALGPFFSILSLHLYKEDNVTRLVYGKLYSLIEFTS